MGLRLCQWNCFMRCRFCWLRDILVNGMDMASTVTADLLKTRHLIHHCENQVHINSNDKHTELVLTSGDLSRNVLAVLLMQTFLLHCQLSIQQCRSEQCHSSVVRSHDSMIMMLASQASQNTSDTTKCKHC